MFFSKFILYVSDEQVHLYKVDAKNVALLTSLEWRDGLFDKKLTEQLLRHVKDSSILILNDTVEQHYRKEKIAKLSPLDSKNIINRKLSIAFPGYPTRAALPIKEPKKKGKAEPQQKDHVFLFAAVPASDVYRKIVEAIKNAECGVSGFVLLPVESVSLVDKIFDKLEKESPQGEKSLWRVLITQHEGGGLRQIVVKNGQIALTRMTPVVTLEGGNGASWASEVAQEFESTVSYLSRFGFVPNDGLEVALIAPNDVSQIVGDMISVPCNFHPLSLQRAADLAGLKLGINSLNTQYKADPLHAAWVAGKAKKVLPLAAKEVETISRPRQAAFFVMLVLLAGFAYTGFMASKEFLLKSAATKNAEIVNAMQIEADKIYNDEIERKKALGIDIALIQGSIAVYNKIDNQFFDPLPLLQAVGQELQELKIDSLSLETEFSSGTGIEGGSAAGATAAAAPSTASGASVNAKAPIGKAILVLKFTFPGDTKPQDGNAQMDALRDRLREKLPQDMIEVTQNLADLSFTGQLQNAVGLTDSGSEKPDFNAELTITRELYDQNSGS